MSWKSPNTMITVFLGIGLVFLFFVLLSMSFRGWGYMGYYGYYHGPSFFYWGGPRVYHGGIDHRSGSLGGPQHRGGGFHGGK